MIAKIYISQPGPDEEKAADMVRQLDGFRVPVQIIEWDSLAGVADRELYDVTGNPAVVICRDNGELVQKWEIMWPRAEDISYEYHV